METKLLALFLVGISICEILNSVDAKQTPPLVRPNPSGSPQQHEKKAGHIVQGHRPNPDGPPQQHGVQGHKPNPNRPPQGHGVQGHGPKPNGGPPQQHGSQGYGPNPNGPPQRPGAQGHKPNPNGPPQQHGVQGQKPNPNRPPQQHGAQGQKPNPNGPPQQHGVQGQKPNPNRPPQQHGAQGQKPNPNGPPQQHGVHGHKPNPNRPPQQHGAQGHKPNPNRPPQLHGAQGHKPNPNRHPQQHGVHGHKPNPPQQYYHFYHHPHPHSTHTNNGTNTHSSTAHTRQNITQSGPGSAYPLELPRGLTQYKDLYKKWWESFHADVSSCGVQNDRSTLFRVIGGRIASIKSWPWMVSMYSTLIGQHWCAGTLIAKDWVLTAAHCFTFVFSDHTTWTLHFGKHNASGSAEYTFEQVRRISTLIKHPDYQPETDPHTFNNDIALVKLDRPVTFNDYTSPLCLVRQTDHVTDHVIEDRDCTITGYGISNKTHNLDEINVLHVAHIPLIDKPTCAALNGYTDKVTDNMICAGFDTGAVDTCKGDSGGPLQCKVDDKWSLVGVTSWGGKNYEGCAEPNEPGVYTDVSRYTEWIYTELFNDYRAQLT